jgi:NAD(P)H-dependent FMN reductase
MEVSTRKVLMNTRRIQIVMLSGITRDFAYTAKTLQWAKAQFEDSNLMSWEIIEA